ncbi:MAG TPA: DNA polymerase I [Bacteroidales bacterium]|jgi:DNA polymerase-1|nr:DNA polymerase I [Bacteroidales bacterium]
MNKVFFLDAYALIFRAYYAFIKNPRINSKGVNTSAIFGFMNSLLDVIQKEKPTHLAIAFDSSAKTFRHDMFPAYKATREATPEDIRKSIPYIKQIIEALEIPMFEVPGYEADDVIGTLAKDFARRDYMVFMMTPDKDYCQLVDTNIFMYKPSRSGSDVEIWGIPEVQRSFEVQFPAQVIDVLGLWGDASDNIPGAPGIGEKTAKKLIKEFGSIESLLQQTDKLSGKIKENLIQFKDQVLLSKKLVTIHTSVPLTINEDDVKLTKPDVSKVTPIFEELEFKGLLRRFYEWSKGITLPSSHPEVNMDEPNLFNQNQNIEKNIVSSHKTIKDIPHDYKLLKTEADFQWLVNEIQKTQKFAFDTETTSLDTVTPEIVGISFCLEPHNAYYINLPINKEESRNILAIFKPVFESNTILKIAQNLKFDYQVLKSYGIELSLPFFDTMVAHYLIEPEQRHNMDFLSQAYLNYVPVSIETLIGDKKSKQLSMRLVEVEKVKEYCCEDSDVTFQLKNVFKPMLIQNNLTSLFEQVEMPLVKVLAEMELAGVKVNESALNEQSLLLTKDLQQLEQEIYQLSGSHFNINSPRQLGDVLFDKLAIDSNAKKTKTKQYATGEEELLKYVDKHPVVNKILEYRTLQKLLSTYIESLPKLIHPKTKRIHTSYSQVTTATGRLSSLNPNLQNIPIREERGREIRKAFVPSEKHDYILSADYSQIELRIMAHLSEDEHMISAFKQNIDIHTATASRIFGVATEQVTREMRSKAKVANFGIIYGISAFGLAQRLNINRTEAKQLIDQYFEKYPDVKKYINRQIELAREKGYVETLLKRRRYLPDINSRNATVRGFAERNAINAPIQGSSADIIKIAMNNVFAAFNENRLKSRLLLQVHDELVFEVTKDELEIVKELIKTNMENVLELKVPLTVEMGYGKNWYEAH